MKVFICHSSKDAEQVTTIGDNLQKYYGLDVFNPKNELRGGEEYPSPLISAVKNCDLLLVFLSENFHNAEFTEQEVGIALGQSKPILPLKTDDTVPFGYIKTKHAATTTSDFNIPATMLRIAIAIYDLYYPTKHDKINAIIHNLEKALSWGAQNSLANMLAVDKNYNYHQLLKLKNMFDKGHFNGSYSANPRIHRILELNPKVGNEERDLEYDPDNDPALYGF